MKKVKEYELVEVNGVFDKQKLIHLLDNGWELYGSPIFVENKKHDEQAFYQAIVKREQKEDDK